jgi:hypothetical protein
MTSGTRSTVDGGAIEELLDREAVVDVCVRYAAALDRPDR